MKQTKANTERLLSDSLHYLRELQEYVEDSSLDALIAEISEFLEVSNV